MAIEIEKKFLVVGNYKDFALSETRIIQGYISLNPERTVRVRIRGKKGYLTIKGAGNKSGASRFEWEKEIPLNEAKELIEICEKGIIDKTRTIVPEKSGLIFEVDEFHGDNLGLTVAEIELPSEDHFFEKPIWLGDEVTNDSKYYNSMLINNPFKKW